MPCVSNKKILTGFLALIFFHIHSVYIVQMFFEAQSLKSQCVRLSGGFKAKL